MRAFCAVRFAALTGTLRLVCKLLGVGRTRPCAGVRRVFWWHANMRRNTLRYCALRDLVRYSVVMLRTVPVLRLVPLV